MAEDTFLDPVDQKQRKQWLYVTMAQLFFSAWPILQLIWFFADSKKLDILSSIFACGIFFSFCAIQVFLLYYFAHKKHGNKFLIGYLTLSILGTIKSLPMFFLLLHMSIFDICTQVLETAIYGWWLFLSYKLISINKKIRLQKHKVLPETSL